MLAKIVKETIRFFMSFVIVEAGSFPEFIRLVRNAENQEIWICANLSERNKPSNEYQLCDVMFVASASDGKTVILKRQETVRLHSVAARTATLSKYSNKHYMNVYLLRNCIGEPVRLMSAMLPRAIIEVNDLYGSKIRKSEFDAGGKYYF